MHIRAALRSDIGALATLIPRSAAALSRGFYPEPQIAGAIGYGFGVDSTLIADGISLVAEVDDEIRGCGGWSVRRTLYGSDRHKDREDPHLDPAVDAARIRAFFVAPEHARRGVGARPSPSRH